MVLPFESMDYGEDRIGATKVSELTDVSITDLADNEILKYNNTSGKWENQAGASLDNLPDVNISNLADGEILKYNNTSSKWENESLNINVSELADVNITSIGDGELLKYNSTSSKFENANLNVSELGDVNITSIGDGELLKYNNTSSKFENANLTLEELNNVNITNLGNGEVLKYDSVTSKWINSDRIDTLNELNDVTVSSPANNQVLKYNFTSSKFVNTTVNLTELGDTDISTLNNGDLLKYDGNNWTTLTPTYLDGAGITNNFHIKLSSNSAVQSNLKEEVTTNDTTFKIFVGDLISTVDGIIKAHTSDSKKKLTLSADNTLQKSLTITEDGRVGINIDNPGEDLEVDGSIQIDSANVSRLKFEKSGQNPHSEAEIDGEEDGTSGGMLEFYTKVDGGSLTEKIRINNVGAVGIGGANYGTSGQILSSNGSGSAVSWIDQTDTTYSAGTGVTINGSNEISIGQSVASSDSPSFTQLSLGVAGTNQGILNLQDITNTGTDTIAQIKGILDGTNGGKLQIFTKEDGGSLTERLSISETGLVKILTDGVGLIIASTDGVTEQGYIYNSSFGTKDFIIEAAVGSSTKGITFRTDGGYDRMRITDTGNVGIGTTSPTVKLDVNGDIKVNDSIHGTSNILKLFTGSTSTDSYSFMEMGTGLTTIGCPAFRVLTNSSNTSFGSERLRILSNGNVGIGTNNPTYKLEVDGTFFCNNITVPGNVANPSFGAVTLHGSLQGSRLTNIQWLQLRNVGNADTSELQTYKVRATQVITDIVAPAYGNTIPNLTGAMGQIVTAPTATVTLVVNVLTQVRSLTIPYTGVWAIDMALYLGNAGNLTGDIKYPTSIRINGSVTQNFYGTNVTGVNGSIKRNLSQNDVVTFHTYLTGSGSSSMTASQRGVWGVAYTFLTATRIA